MIKFVINWVLTICSGFLVIATAVVCFLPIVLKISACFVYDTSLMCIVLLHFNFGLIFNTYKGEKYLYFFISLFGNIYVAKRFLHQSRYNADSMGLFVFCFFFTVFNCRSLFLVCSLNFLWVMTCLFLHFERKLD